MTPAAKRRPAATREQDKILEVAGGLQIKQPCEHCGAPKARWRRGWVKSARRIPKSEGRPKPEGRWGCARQSGCSEAGVKLPWLSPRVGAYALSVTPMLAPAIFASLAMPAFAGKLSKSIAKQQHQNEQSGTEYYKNGSIKSKHGVAWF